MIAVSKKNKRHERILALDLGNTTGWAYQHKEGHRVSGVWKIQIGSSPHPGRRFCELRLRIANIYANNGIDSIAFEEPQQFKNRSGYRVQYGCRAVVEAFSWDHDLPQYVVNPKTLKKWGVGDGNAPKDKLRRKAAKLWPLKRWITHDETDAFFVLHYRLYRMGLYCIAET